MLNSYYLSGNDYIKYFHHKSKEGQDIPFHLQDMYEIYFFISGSVNYFIEKNVYQLSYGDLFIINSSEIHKATSRSGETYERIVLLFDPELINLFGSDQFSLLDCFINRPKGEQNKIGLSNHQIEEIKNLLSRFNVISSASTEAANLLRLAYLIELLVYLNKVVLNAEANGENQTLPKKLAPILDYIDNNLTGNLSLQSLASTFYINKYYLSTLFKTNTGINIHEYIILKRISKAKNILCENVNIRDACQLSGFCDYSHFIRAFKQYVGVSPGVYRKQHALVEKRNLLSD